ncbi:MAG: hypothetical protein FJW39_21960 [Acidobacteria bacterium]|nr:hypothetical protein [Acidobacteriota bacterium]
MRFTLLFAATAILLADKVEQSARDSKPSGLLAGTARADISPPVGIPQMNWGAQTHVTAESIDPAGMWATALVISDGRQKFAMVDVDALFVNLIDSVPARVQALTGIPAAHVRMGATHTHAGPFLNAEKGPVGIDLTQYQQSFRNYWDLVADKVVGAIVEANSKLRPAHLGGMRGTGTINVNRRVRAMSGAPPSVGRNPDGAVDRDLNVVRIDGADGRPIAILVNFQCHGTVMAWENKAISPDWPGMTRKVVEQAFPGAHCLYIQGAAGNQGPIEGFTGDLGVAHRLGRILGHQAVALALQIETTRRAPAFEGFSESTAFIAKQPWRVAGPRESSLKFTTEVLDLPRRTYTSADIERIQQSVDDAATKAAKAKEGNDPWAKHVAEARLRRFEDLLGKWRKAPTNEPIKVRVQILRMGEVAIVAMPGEPFMEIGQAIKKASPFGLTLFAGYSNGEGGEYMPVEDEYGHAGYEVDRTPYGPGAAAKLVRETIALFPRVK